MILEEWGDGAQINIGSAIEEDSVDPEELEERRLYFLRRPMKMAGGFATCSDKLHNGRRFEITFFGKDLNGGYKRDVFDVEQLRILEIIPVKKEYVTVLRFVCSPEVEL